VYTLFHFNRTREGDLFLYKKLREIPGNYSDKKARKGEIILFQVSIDNEPATSLFLVP